MVLQKITGLFNKEDSIKDHDDRDREIGLNINEHKERIIQKCKEFMVPESMYLEWLERNQQEVVLGFEREFPFYLQKYDSYGMETEVIQVRFKYIGNRYVEDMVLWEYRRFGYPEGKLHAVEGKRKLLTNDEIMKFINNDEFKWVNQMNPPICVSFSLAMEGKLDSTYEDLKGEM